MASCAAGAAAGGIVLLSAGGSSPPSVARPAGEATATPAALSPPKHPRGVLLGCSRRSEANFPGAYAAPDNLVVGPLALIGGAYTPASVVREFGGNKFPLLVEAGHTVTLRVSRRARGSAGLAYGGLGRRPLPQGRQTRLRDAARTMTFRACRPGSPPKDYRPEGPSGSDADGESVTFWSGFVVARAPACVPLEVYVDDEPPRRVGLALGRRCGERPIVAATCVHGGTGTTEAVPTRDVAIGPLTLLGVRQTPAGPADAFNRIGYKIPVTLPEGTTATLSVPASLRGRVGLVFTQRAQDRVTSEGVRGADSLVRFTACRPRGEPGRTGWPGGIVVDRPRCGTLTVRAPRAAAIERRVPLGRRC